MGRRWARLRLWSWWRVAMMTCPVCAGAGGTSRPVIDNSGPERRALRMHTEFTPCPRCRGVGRISNSGRDYR